MKGLDFNSLFQAYSSKGYPFYDSGKFNINIFGIRDSSNIVDEFNDILGVAYIDEFGRPIVLAARGTTKPGLYYLTDHLGGAHGTFILKEGYYKSCWARGLHSGKYDALRQSSKAEFIGWRDKDKDGQLDMDGELFTDVSGLNFHTTSFINDKEKVGAYSAGCQVVQDDKDFMMLRAVIYRSMEIYGNNVSYALFNIKDFF